MLWFERASPRTRARITGAVYLLFFLTAVGGALIPPGLTAPGPVPTDAAAVARKITGNESSYEISVAFGLISTLFYVALIGLLYLLFRVVSRTSALLAAFFGLVGCAVTAVASLFQLAPIVVLGHDSYLKSFTDQQLQSMALILLNIGGDAGAVALAFFGVFQLFLGYVIIRARFMPWPIGAVVALAGVGWLTYLYPPLATFLTTPLAVLGIVAEGALMLWLLIFGVNSDRWREVAAAPGQ